MWYIYKGIHSVCVALWASGNRWQQYCLKVAKKNTVCQHTVICDHPVCQLSVGQWGGSLCCVPTNRWSVQGTQILYFCDARPPKMAYSLSFVCAILRLSPMYMYIYIHIYIYKWLWYYLISNHTILHYIVS